MSNRSRLYNLEKLYTIENRDTDFIKEVVSLFLKTIPQLSRDLVKAAKEKKWDDVYFLAHKMKATIDLLNIESLQKEIRVVEQNAKSKNHLECIFDKANFIDSTILQCAEEIKKDFMVVKD